MRRPFERRLTVSAVIAATLLSAPWVRAEGDAKKNGVVVTAHALATEAGVAAMKRGGNAIDGAVAAALTLGVVDGSNSGIGGGCFILVRTARGEFLAIDGRETAPAAATREMFVRDGKADTRLSQVGALASGVPGALAAYDLALRKSGKLSLSEHLRAAAIVAEEGFEISGEYRSRLKSSAEELAEFESSRAIFLQPDGRPLEKGAILKQADLAEAYRAIAEHGLDWFYRGPFARAVGDWMKRNGGLLSADDFARYEAKLREPIRSSYRGYDIVSFPPPSSGGVHLSQMLNILEGFDLRAFGQSSPDAIHVVAEAMKLAFADRAFWMGDPDFVPVPRGLTRKEYAKALAARIDLTRALEATEHGTPENAGTDVFGRHTTHLSTADGDGNWVALTATLNTAFGSKVVVPGTGVMLNNEMDDFAAQPGVPNAFNLVGGEANAVAPHKRPLSSMTPTIVLRDGEPQLAIGAAGGPTIITQVLLAILNIVDFDLDVAGAVAGARFHHQWKPDELKLENTIAPDVRAALQERGHKLAERDPFGACQAAGRDASGAFVGAAEPRNDGTAAAW